MAVISQIVNQNVCDIWCLATEFADAYAQLAKAGCITNIEIHPTGAGAIWLRGYGQYSLITKVLPNGSPLIPGQFKVINSLGTEAQWYPDWDAPNMPGGWIAKDTILNVVAMIAIRDERWLLLEKNKGWVNLIRCMAVPPTPASTPAVLSQK